VISACGTVDEDMIRKLEVGPESEKLLRNPDCCGGSIIVSPGSRIVAGPMGAEEGILYAQCNLELGVLTKLRHDFVGHYNRPDIFQLQVNRAAPRIYTVRDESLALPPVMAPDGRLARPDAPRLAGAVRRGARRHDARKRARAHRKKR